MNVVDIGLSFLEGLALIASPCILPVLPLVLGASVTGGKKRPFGIIFGFVLAFTLFAMLSRELVSVLGINLNILKSSSLILLGLFGLILLSERLSNIFSAATQSFASAGNKLTVNAKEGFFSGVFIGMLIGLIWTPCAGPILAAALVQIIRQESDIQALLLVISFAIGAGVPMLIIAITGRKIMSKLKFFTVHAEAVRKIFGVLILLAVAFITSGANLAFGKDNVNSKSTVNGLENALAKPYDAPEFNGIQTWLNSTPIKMSSLKGNVVLIDFWTYSCINCVRTLPYITQWDRNYRDKGLVIVGVHSPEFEFEKDINNIKNALVEHNIKYPVAVDNNLDTWSTFKNHYWPAHYLIDKSGKVVYVHFGEGEYMQTENNIRYLLGMDAKNNTYEDVEVHPHNQTPETYLGLNRATNFTGTESLQLGKVANFTLPIFVTTDHWALSGRWRIDADRIVSMEAGAKLQLNFTAGKVYLVLGTPNDKPLVVTLKLNDEPLTTSAGKDATSGQLTVKQHTLYELVDQKGSKNGLLEITTNAPGLEAYAFTFGN